MELGRRKVRTHSRRDFALAVILIASCVAVYFPAINGGFLWDDDHYVSQNQNLRTLDGLGRIWLHIGATPQYYPLVFTSFWVEYQLWQAHTLGYHLVNILLHAVGALLVWRILVRLKVSGGWLAAAVFALHPVQVESVAWITERKNALSAVFYLAALLAWIRYFGLDRRDNAEQGDVGWWLYLLGCGLFVCALLSKTVTCTLPIVILLLIWWKRGEVLLREFWAIVPMLVIGLGAGLLTVWIEHLNLAGTGTGARGADWDLSILQRFLLAGRALWFYLTKLIWPTQLCFIYPRWAMQTSGAWQLLFPLSFTALLAILYALRERLTRGPLVAMLFFAVTLAPALGFVNVYPFRYSFVADHFQYLASLGPIVLLCATGWVLLARGPRVRAVSGTAVLAVLGVLSWQQAHVYRSLDSLWQTTIDRNPQAWMAYANYGILLQSRRELPRAIAMHEQAVTIRPDDPRLRLNLAVALADGNRADDALREYESLLKTSPQFPDLYYNLGNHYARLGRTTDAENAYREALRLRPGYARAHNNLGDLFMRAGKIDRAIEHFRAAIEADPNYPIARSNLAVAEEAEAGQRRRR